MRRAVVAVAAAAALALSGCSAAPDAAEAEPDVGVQLFQWPWPAIAEECENTLGPAGFDWVLTSPAQEHVVGEQWWVSYQPVSYRLESRLGTREEFADMVARCREAGVGIVADAVVNHMTGQDEPGTGWAGSTYAHTEYPGIWSSADFHACGLTPDDDIRDYDVRAQVQTCELVNLADLDTASPRVRERLGAFLADLVSLGVSGVRIDAAKHMAAEDVAAIVAPLPDDVRVISEVIRGPLEPIQPEEYLGFGDVFEFSYARDLAPQLRSGIFADPAPAAEGRAMHVPADQAVVFVDNHDTERGEAGVTGRDGDLYVLANVLLLADDFGTPVVYSGYAFDDRDAGAPTGADGRVVADPCTPGEHPDAAAGERTCTHAWAEVAGMLDFRRAVGDAPRLPGVADAAAYGFEREGRGVVGVNAGDESVELEVPTSMPAGEYCDVVLSGGRGADCPDGGAVIVADGVARLSLAPGGAVAIHVGARLP